MLFWVAVIILWLLGEAYPPLKTAARIFAFIAAVIGLLILFKIGFIPAFLTAVIQIPIDLISGIFGIIKALLLGQP